MHPQILYWKWNDGLFDEQVLEEKALDIIKRSTFRDIAIAPHSMTKPEGSYLNPVLQGLVRKVNDIFKAHGRHVIMDVDMRHPLEYGAFFKKAPDKFTYQARLYQLDLDENGRVKQFRICDKVKGECNFYANMMVVGRRFLIHLLQDAAMNGLV